MTVALGDTVVRVEAEPVRLWNDVPVGSGGRVVAIDYATGTIQVAGYGNGLTTSRFRKVTS